MNSKKGFTLVELVVVIAILAIIAAIAIPVVNSVVNSASLSSTYANARAIERSIASARADLAAKNRETYGLDAVKATITVGQVITENSLQEACKTSPYYGREIVPVWNLDNGTVVVVYADDFKLVDSDVTVENYILFTETEDTLIKDLPAS